LNFFEYAQKLKPEQLEHYRGISGSKSGNTLDIYNAFMAFLEKNITDYLSDFRPLEALIFYRALKKQGFELESLDEHSSEERKKALQELKNKGLVYTTISVQKVTPVTKVFVFPEIVEIIRKKIRFYQPQEMIEKINRVRDLSINCRYDQMPPDMFFFFYSFGLVCRKDFVIQQFGEAAVRYFIEEGVISECILILEKGEALSFYGCFELDESRIEQTSFNVIRNISYQTRIFNDIIRLIYLITKEDILITKKGDINKKHYDKLAKEMGSEHVLWFLIQFLVKFGFVETHPKRKYIYLTAKGHDFFQQEVEEVYQKLLSTDPFLEKVYSIISGLHREDFGLADIIFEFVKEEIETSFEVLLWREKRRDVVKYVEILTYMGILIQKYTGEGFVIYSFNPHYKNIAYEKESQRKPIVVSPSLEVSAYPQELDLQTGYLLNIFMEIRNFSDVITYQLSPRSVKRALYFGFDIEELVKALKEKSRNEVPTNVEMNLRRWKEQFRPGTISSVILLEASEEILDRLAHHPEYQHLIQRRITGTLAAVTREIYENRILEDLDVYFYTREEEI
jgi:ribosomal protein S19E (S16A)